MVYLNLTKSVLEKTIPEANKEGIAELGEEDGKDCLIWETKKNELTSLEITDTEITADFDTELGYISVKIPIDADALEELVSVAVKRLNKLKTLMESIK